MKVRDNPLKRIPPTIREKGLQGILGKDRVIECTPHNNFYLIKVANEKDAELLLKQDKLMTTPTDFISVEFETHNQLSQTKGVLFDRMNELEDLSTDDITEALKNQGVVRTDRLPPRAINLNDRRKPGTTYFLTFLSDRLPDSVRIGCDFFRISEYTPRPRMCRNCLRYGHGANKCRGKETCLYCHQGDHNADACPTKDTPQPCYHCKAPGHTAGNPECSEYAYQKQIAVVMQQDKLLFWQAKQEVDKTWIKPDAKSPTFATVAATGQPATASTSHAERENANLKSEVAELKEIVAHLNASMDELKATLGQLCADNTELKKKADDALANDQQSCRMLKEANAKIRELQQENAKLKSKFQNQQTPQQVKNTNKAAIQTESASGKKGRQGVGDTILKKDAGSSGKTALATTPAKTAGAGKEDQSKKRSAHDLSPSAAGSSNTSKKQATLKDGKPLLEPVTAEVVTDALNEAVLSYDSDESITESDLMDHSGSQNNLSLASSHPSNE